MKKTIFALLSLCLLSACDAPSEEPNPLVNTPSAEPAKYSAFAECLTNSGAILYGTEWCPHCKAQRVLFGDALSKVNEVDCDEESDLCKEAGITGYPTWVFGDETRRSGTQPLADLAEITGCKLPEEESPATSS